MSRVNRSLVSYAFLAQAKRAEGDLLSGLMPIFKPLAKMFEGEKFDPPKFSELAAELYGLNVNPWAIESLTPRLEAAGVLVKIKTTDYAHEYAYAHITEEFTAVSEQDISLILEKFISFSKPIISLHAELQLSEEEIKSAFLQHIVDIDFVAALLRPTRKLGTDNKPRLGLPKTKEQVETEEERFKGARIDTLCAAFILELYHKEKELYELICRITAGALISEVVLNFQEPETGISLKSLKIFLDAPLLMEILDLDSKDSYKVSSGICEQLIAHEAKLAVFRHSVEELKDNLGAVIGAYEAGEGFGPTARRLGESAFRAYATAMRVSPEARIKAAGIEIIDTPKTTSSYGYFTEQQETTLCQSLGFYQNRRAQERDAASIAGVVRLRAGTRTSNGKLQNSKVLFLTSNPWLASKSTRTLTRTKFYEENEVPAAITSRDMAGLLWVLYGGKAGSLPAEVLLANCAAAVEPKADLIQRMHNFLSKVDKDQAKYFEALMTEERASQYLSQLSLGDSIFITENNAEIVLESMRQSLIEQHEIKSQKSKEEYETKIKETEKEHEQKIETIHRTTQEQHQQLRQNILDSETEKLQIEKQRKEDQKRITALEEKLIQSQIKQEEQEERIINLSAIAASKHASRLIITIAAMMAILGITGGILGGITEVFALQISGYLIAAGVTMCSFWHIPEKLFGSKIEHLKQKKLIEEIEFRGLSPNVLKAWSIDWKNKKAQKLLEYSQNQQINITLGKDDIEVEQ